MRNTLRTASLLAVGGLFTLGCSPDRSVAPDAASQPSVLLSQSSRVGRGVLWADGILFDVIAPPAVFSNPQGMFDELYKGGNGFLDGIGAISDAAPGDADYNGGRWHVNVLKDGVDPDKYVSASSADELDPADFESTDVYFECPLAPHGPSVAGR